MKLEISFKDKPRFEALSLAFTPIPAPVPTAGTPSLSKPSFVCGGLVVVSLVGYTPDFGRFYGSRGHLYCGCRARQKPPSSLTRKRVTDGRVFERFGLNVRYEFGRVYGFAAGAIPASLAEPRTG